MTAAPEPSAVDGTGVGTLRMTGEVGAVDAAGSGGENLGTGDRTGAGRTGLALEGGGKKGLTTTGIAGAGGVAITIGREEIAAVGTGGVARGEFGVAAAVPAVPAAGAAGLTATGAMTDGNPNIVRLSGGRAAPGAGVVEVGCGVMPVRATGIAADGRAPGIRDGREAGGAAAGGDPDPGVAMGSIPDGRVGGFTFQADGTEAGVGPPLSMVISP